MRFDPAPLRNRAIRDGWVHPAGLGGHGDRIAGRVNAQAIAAHTPWTPETVGALIRGDADGNGRRADGLTWWQADRLAVAIGCHPAEIWDDWHDMEASA